MTKFHKQMLTIAAAGALTAVTALPAMAFENEFHGLFNFNTVFSNYNNGGGGDVNPGAATWGKSKKMNNYMEQRSRIQYVAKASDDLKLYTQLETNTRWGNGSVGGDLDTDGGTNTLVVKHAYLDFNIGKSFNTKVGLQAYKDSLKGIFIDADMPIVMTTTKMGAYTLGLGFGRFADDQTTTGSGVTRAGDADKDLFVMDNTYALSKDTKLGFSYYFLADYAATAPTSGYTGVPYNVLYGHTKEEAILLHTFGLNGQTKLAGINLSGFAAMQAGHQKVWTAGNTSRNFHGWAANVAADMKMGPGKLKTAFLFTSGNNSTNDAQYKGWVSTSVNSYNESGMMILARNTANSPTSTDAYIRRDVTNIALLTMGYDAQLTDKFNLNSNVGFAWAPSSNGQEPHVDLNTSETNSSDFMGTEINVEAGYQLYKNLKLQAQVGYMILGGYYHKTTTNSALTTAEDPENPYTMRLQARYSF